MTQTTTYTTYVFVLFFFAGLLNPSFSRDNASEMGMEHKEYWQALEQKATDLNQLTNEMNERYDYYINKIKVLRTHHSRLYDEFQNSVDRYEKGYLAEIISFTDCLTLREVYIHYYETGKTATEIIKLAEEFIKKMKNLDSTHKQISKKVNETIEEYNDLIKSRKGIMALKAVNIFFEHPSGDEMPRIATIGSEYDKILLEYLTQSNRDLKVALEAYLNRMELYSQNKQSNMKSILTWAHEIRLFSEQKRDLATNIFHSNTNVCFPWTYLFNWPSYACKN